MFSWAEWLIRCVSHSLSSGKEATWLLWGCFQLCLLKYSFFSPLSFGKRQRQRRRLSSKEASPLKTKASSLHLTLGLCPAATEGGGTSADHVAGTLCFAGQRWGSAGEARRALLLGGCASCRLASGGTLICSPFPLDLSHPEIIYFKQLL